MDKRDILKSLDFITEKIEQKFDTTILRKLMAPRAGTMFLSVYPIDNSTLNGTENNVFGPNFPRLRSFDDKEFNIICTILVPIHNASSKDFVIHNDMKINEITFNDIIEFCTNDLGIKVYDGGKIKMSYEMTNVLDTDTFYCTKDSLITADIYAKLGTVAYGRIIYYV